MAPSPLTMLVAADPDSLRAAWVYFAAVSVLLAVFLIVVALGAAVRRRRRGRSADGAGPEGELPSPWREAGRRAKGYRRD